MLPEPFVGSLNAPVVVLLENPGAGGGKEDFALHRQLGFQLRVRACHRQKETAYPHYFLAPKVDGPGARWTARILKPLIEEFGVRVVASGIVFLEYFPYHSRNFAHSRIRVPSREFTFQALQRAIRRGATVIITRGKRIWIEAVPELGDYRLAFTTSSVQNVAISPHNCRFASIAYGKKRKPWKRHPSGYEAARAALRKLARRRKASRTD